MKHFSDEELIKPHVEKHLQECPSCLMRYNFLSMKMRVESYIGYKKETLNKTPCPSRKEIEDYIKDKNKSIKEHLTCCETCASIYFNLKPANNFWYSIEKRISEMKWIKDVFLFPELALSRGRTSKTGDKTFIGDYVKLEIPVSKDGYLTAIHWNGEKCSLIFPNLNEKDTFVKSQTVKIIKGKIDPPPGIQKIKVFLTEENILGPIDFQNEKFITGHIKEFIKNLDDLDDDKWSEKIFIYEVMECCY
jgi:hypothetical protein